MIDTTATRVDIRASGGRWYLVFALFLVSIMYNLDRGILSIMIEPIKLEFQLNDTQVGFLTGIAFALFFGVAGIPLGRWVDRGNRKVIISSCLFVFSLMTAACGFAMNFVQLLAARLAVGAGEGGCAPAIQSMISDHFPPERRASALSMSSLGSPASQILTFLFGGMLVATYGWRSMFWVAGGLGLALAAFILVTIREPERRSNTGGAAAEPLPFKQVLLFILKQRSLLHILGTGMITSALSSGVSVWAVSFLIRSHHMQLQDAGPILALGYGGAAAAGIAMSGITVDWLGRRDIRWRAWFCALTQLIGLPMFLLFVQARSAGVAIVGFAVYGAMMSAIFAPVGSLCQSLVGSRMRGSIAAVYYFLANFIGWGLGPQIVGIASDLLHPHFGAESLRYALTAACPLLLWAMFHYYRAGITLEKDLHRAAEAR